jgi:hypothetical protein
VLVEWEICLYEYIRKCGTQQKTTTAALDVNYPTKNCAKDTKRRKDSKRGKERRAQRVTEYEIRGGKKKTKNEKSERQKERMHFLYVSITLTCASMKTK